VIVFRFDRFARSVKQLVIALEEFHSLGIDFVSHQEALDTSTPIGKAMFTIIAAIAESERSVIRERVISGLEYARLPLPTRPVIAFSKLSCDLTATGQGNKGTSARPSAVSKANAFENPHRLARCQVKGSVPYLSESEAGPFHKIASLVSFVFALIYTTL
jgi:hypothetical protein